MFKSILLFVFFESISFFMVSQNDSIKSNQQKDTIENKIQPENDQFKLKMYNRNNQKVKFLYGGDDISLRMNDGERLKGEIQWVHANEMAVDGYKFNPDNLFYVRHGGYNGIALSSFLLSTGFLGVYMFDHVLDGICIDFWDGGSGCNTSASNTVSGKDIFLISGMAITFGIGISSLFVKKYYYHSDWKFSVESLN